MRCNLSTLFLCIVIVALSLGWYLDHYERQIESHDFVGLWRSAKPGEYISDRFVELAIDDSGTFTMMRVTRDVNSNYRGICRRLSPNLLKFHVTSTEATDNHTADFWPEEKPVTREIDMTFLIEYSLDHEGQLYFSKISNLPFGDQLLTDRHLRWDNLYVRKAYLANP